MYFSHYISLRGGEQWPCAPQAHAFLVLLMLPVPWDPGPSALPSFLWKRQSVFCGGYEGLTENPPS